MLQQKLRVGPGKQLIPKAEISAVLEFHALHEEKKKRRGAEPLAKYRSHTEQTPPLLTHFVTMGLAEISGL